MGKRKKPKKFKFNPNQKDNSSKIFGLEPDTASNRTEKAESQRIKAEELISQWREEEDDDEQTEYKMVGIKFEYQTSCSVQKQGEGEKVTLQREGLMECTFSCDLNELECAKDDFFFSKAIEHVLGGFYDFEVEKKGYHDMSDVSISIKNLEVIL